MTDLTRIAGFGVVLVAALGLGYGAGVAVGPAPEPPEVVDVHVDDAATPVHR